MKTSYILSRSSIVDSCQRWSAVVPTHLNYDWNTTSFSE